MCLCIGSLSLSLYVYKYVYIYIYIYIYIYTCIPVLGTDGMPGPQLLRAFGPITMPSPPTKSFPTKSPRVELSGRLPITVHGHESSHPLELRVCLSRTL